MALVLANNSKTSPQDIEAKPGIVGSRFFVDKRIGEGSFGVIYKGERGLVARPILSLCRCGMSWH